MSDFDFGHVPLVKVTRGDAVESVHYGAIVVADSRGAVLAGVGSPEATTFLRSAAKPFQVLPILTSGAADHYRLTRKDLAVIIASHNGEKMHLDAVRAVLKKAALKESDLQCGSHAPFYRPAAVALAKSGKSPSVLHNNCSGKHAGMLALARFWKAPLGSYLAPDHPVQKAVLRVLSLYCNVSEAAILGGVDGCSAPTFAVSLRQAAQGYARLLDPHFGSREERDAAGRAVSAMRGYPELVGGTGRLDNALMRAVGKSFIAKIGAEGFYGLAYRDNGKGIGIALKIADGNGDRARATATVELLMQMGLLGKAKAARLLDSQGLPQVRNVRQKSVGRVAGLFQIA
jgi:L-asparaginase II